MSDDDMPQLDDFEENLKTVQYAKKQSASKSSEDYTKPNLRHIEDEERQKAELKQLEKKVEDMSAKLESAKPKEAFGGFKKGFFSGAGKEKKEEKVVELKGGKANPLELKEVQEAMKVNNYLEETKKEWLTDNFLSNVESNAKVQKLFSNPEYMKAIGEFQTNPKQAMAKYAGNKDFMEGFQEFCKLMGNQFQNLAKNQKK